MNKHNPWATFYVHDLNNNEAYMLATAAQRGVWFGVLMRAIYENTGPRLPNALAYADRVCFALYGCSAAELKRPNPLLRHEGQDVVVVFGYPDAERFRFIRQRESNAERKRRYRQKISEREA